MTKTKQKVNKKRTPLKNITKVSKENTCYADFHCEAVRELDNINNIVNNSSRQHVLNIAN